MNTDFPDLDQLGAELRQAAPPATDLQRITGRGQQIRRRRHTIQMAFSMAIIALLSVPVVSALLNRAPSSELDIVAPPGEDSSLIDPALLPRAAIVVAGELEYARMSDETALTTDYGLLSLDGEIERSLPVHEDVQSVLGLDVPSNAVADDFTNGVRRRHPDGLGGCQVGIGRDSERGLGFSSADDVGVECPSGMAVSPRGTILAWSEARDTGPVLRWQRINPAGPDAPREEQRPSTTSGSVSGSDLGSPSLYGEVFEAVIPGAPADAGVIRWNPGATPSTSTLVLDTPSGALLVPVTSNGSDISLAEAQPATAPVDGVVVLDVAPSSRPDRPCPARSCTDVLLTRDAATGAVRVMRADGGEPLTLPASISPDRWTLDALDAAVVVSDGEAARLYAWDGQGWQGPQQIPRPIRQARFVPWD